MPEFDRIITISGGAGGEAGVPIPLVAGDGSLVVDSLQIPLAVEAGEPEITLQPLADDLVIKTDTDVIGTIPAGSVLRIAGTEYEIEEAVVWGTTPPLIQMIPFMSITAFRTDSIGQKYLEGGTDEDIAALGVLLYEYLGWPLICTPQAGGDVVFSEVVTDSRVNHRISDNYPIEFETDVLYDIAVSNPNFIEKVSLGNDLAAAAAEKEEVELLSVPSLGRKFWARLDDKSGLEETIVVNEIRQTRVKESATWVMRFDPTISLFNTLVDDAGETWNIVSIRDVGRRRKMTLEATRAVSQ